MENLLYLLDFFISNISIGTFLIAVLTFIITFTNFYNNRAVIEVSQHPGSLSVLIKPDFIDMKTPDPYWHNEYRIITDIIITNKSSKPISIIEFLLNDQFRFNTYHVPANEYQVTIRPKKYESNGMIAYGNSKVGKYPIDDLWLKPIIDIPPQTTVRGHLFFHLPDKTNIHKGKNTLKIITSRKTFVKDLYLSETHESRLPLPDKILSARDQTF